MTAQNFSLKDEIREYWSKRSETFDVAFGHRIPRGPEFDAWQKQIRDHLGPKPLRVLELACGTGEVTALIHDLGHDVTALDFSEAMLAVAKTKQAAKDRLRFLLADAENPMEPEASYDAIICRHLVWTLTDPAKAFNEWHSLLRPGGILLIFDGDWAKPTSLGRVASSLISMIDRFQGEDAYYDGAMGDRHSAIMTQLPFGSGLVPGRILPLLAEAGFEGFQVASHSPIAKAQRTQANWRNWLRTFVYRRFILLATAKAI
ncbi:class I SAM-dependent methyltransferase [Mesorhizobium sp.]|uniref:class I SAM-dependent methyltransferase n=1 Tax=Mesorhizobium sp. TaxID=1871066 RepID=UPI0025DDDF11|nr:class I SAM-dependent methyltransferase [Mesorhizobium sp.]